MRVKFDSISPVKERIQDVRRVYRAVTTRTAAGFAWHYPTSSAARHPVEAASRFRAAHAH
jgi:hypothetical protein